MNDSDNLFLEKIVAISICEENDLQLFIHLRSELEFLSPVDTLLHSS